jgi:hypothetical protein
MRNTHLLRIAYSYLPALSDTTLAVCTSPLSQTTLDPLPSFLGSFLPCALEQPKFLDFPNHNFLLSLVDQTFDSTTATDFLFALATMARASLSLHDISRVFRVLSITRFVRPSILFCFCYSKKSSSPWGTSTSGPGETTFSRALSVRNVMSPQWWHIPPYNLRPGLHEGLGVI